MCGLVGVAGTINNKEEKAFTELLLLDSIRGPHSTGVARVKRYGPVGENKVSVFKTLGSAYRFFSDVDTKELTTLVSKVLLGHNRWATKGGVTIDNAHPFEFDNVVGAHNGTLINQTLLDNHAYYEVDSENIYYHMNKHGARETIRNLYGAFALTWWNKEAETLNFVRNNERTLYYVFSKDMRTVFWASEKWMLEAVRERCKLDLLDPILLPVNQLLTLELPQTLTAITSIKVGNVEVYTPPKKILGGNYVGRGTSITNNGYPKQLTKSTVHNSIQSANYSEKSGVVENLFKTSGADKSNMRKMVGKYTDVRATSYVDISKGNSYINARCLEAPLILVRLYIQKGTKLWDELDLNDKAIVGKRLRCRIKLISNSFEYLVADLRTVSEWGVDPINSKPINLHNLPFQKQSLPKLYQIYNGILVDQKSFESAVSEGCEWCSGPIWAAEHEDTNWTNDRKPICKCCSKLEDVKPFIN